ncbi:hypothetical protein ACH347_11450 [Saccharopolyspora sp. 5N102]|uniref:hypothetical protein n=1 Tax=Saccharopolyspora sp. 5N102 TaxID=3375155 RepID=UPI0037909AFA
MSASATTTARPELVEVADGVLAYVQPAGGWCVNNAGVLVSGGSAALVDTVATEARARRLREQVLAVASGPRSRSSTRIRTATTPSATSSSRRR